MRLEFHFLLAVWWPWAERTVAPVAEEDPRLFCRVGDWASTATWRPVVGECCREWGRPRWVKLTHAGPTRSVANLELLHIKKAPTFLTIDLTEPNKKNFLSFSVIFDPASFYGHHEFDLAIAGMFGGFTSKFYDAYHHLIPKAPGFPTRHKLYVLFHYINHW